MVSASQLRPGMGIHYQGQPYKVITADYHPGQGKMGGVTHARLQNLATRTFWETSFRSDLKFDEVPLARQTLEFLYASGGQVCFMNNETFEQTEVPESLAGAQADLLEPGMTVSIEFLAGRPVCVSIPDVLEVRIAETAPPAHQHADGSLKPARLAQGLEVMVPSFIKTGDVIRLDVPNRKYLDRVRTEAKVRA